MVSRMACSSDLRCLYSEILHVNNNFKVTHNIVSNVNIRGNTINAGTGRSRRDGRVGKGSDTKDETFERIMNDCS